MEQKNKIVTLSQTSLLITTFWQMVVVFLVPKILGLTAALIINQLLVVYLTLVISAILVYLFIFWLAKQYLKRGYFNDKKFQRNFLILSAIFFIFNLDFIFSLLVFLVLVFFLQQPKLLSLKNPAYQPHLKMIYKMYLVSLGLAIIGNIFYLVFSMLGQSNGHDYLAWMLFPRFTAPFFALLIYAFYLIFKQGFDQTLKLSRVKFTFYFFAILVATVLGLGFTLISFLSSFALGILGESFMWVASVFTFIAVFALFYNLAKWLLSAKETEPWWKYLLKLICNLIIIPICFGILLDYISIMIYTVTNAFAWKDQFRIPFLLHPFRLFYAAFILYFFFIYKKDLVKNKFLACLAYLIIICFILSALESVIKIHLFPPFI